MRSCLHLLAKVAPAAFYGALQKRQIDAYFGVPDSLLKDLCAFITENVGPQQHVITANEGNAVAMAAGYHLATGRVPVVYMQNSGFGNVMNPLLSLTHKEVYQIPMLLLVGWRGDPGKHDEPQHVAQGRLMSECLKSCEVPFAVLEQCDNTVAKTEEILAAAEKHFKENGTPFAILIKRDTFDSYKMKEKAPAVPSLAMTREQALDIVLTNIGKNDIVVSTTGMPSREVFELRAKNNAGHQRDFLTVGCMGHCSSIAAGIAMAKPDRNVVCIDGDGAAIMHLGSMAVNGSLGLISTPAGSRLNENLKHVVINNGAHDSVGGQPTFGFDVSLAGVAKSCNYNVVTEKPCTTVEEAVAGVKALVSTKGPAYLEIRVKKGNRKDLGRPTKSPLENKKEFEAFVRSSSL
jgi:phosphonopyruvate decarboxylase